MSREPFHREPVRGTPDDELWIVSAAWNEKYGSNDTSVKYAWRDKNGHWARGGEIPLDNIDQLVEMVVREGYKSPANLLRAIAQGIDGAQSGQQAA
jgi:hypothetical protein